MVSRHFNMLELISYKITWEDELMAEGSSSQFTDKAIEHYSSLFWLPSRKRAVLLLALVCLSAGTLSTVFLFPIFQGLVEGFFLGMFLFFLDLLLNYVVSALILRRDAIYNLTRTTALSLYCWVIWLFFIFAGIATAQPFGSSLFIRLCLLGFSAVLVLRLTIFSCTSFAGYGKLVIASYLQPCASIISFLVTWARIDYPILIFVVFSLIMCSISSFSFVFLLNTVGNRTLGFPSFSIFKAFLINWAVGSNAPFEEFLEQLGQEQDIEISIIKFGASKPKAVMVVPSVHPGPFRNIGSSLLPFMLKASLERKLDCVVGVPHGLLGHEFDLVSQRQNQKIINHVIEAIDFSTSEMMASPFVLVTDGLVTACCQIFGKSAFFSFTLAPNTIEDLPRDLGLFVSQEAQKRGLRTCTIVNAHNSINGKSNITEVLGALKKVAVASLDEAISLKQLPFEVGAATGVISDFGVKHGMGPGGITVITVKVGEQKTAYVIIDGNNLVSGLRETILSVLRLIGVNQGEVFTTDTHSVNGVIFNERGYHPVGESIDHKKLIQHIRELTILSLSNLEPVKVATHSTIIPRVKVIGEKQLESLSLLSERTIREAKKVVIPIFAFCGLLLILFLLFV
jgi:putative membrane protein